MILQEALALSSMYTPGHSGQIRAAIERGIALAEALEDRVHQLRLLAGLNFFLIRLGDPRAALAAAEHGGAIAQGTTDRAGLISAEWMLGMSHHFAGNQAAAQLHCERGLMLAAELGTFNANYFGVDHRILGLVALAPYGCPASPIGHSESRRWASIKRRAKITRSRSASRWYTTRRCFSGAVIWYEPATSLSN
jgi:hypothetical protein